MTKTPRGLRNNNPGNIEIADPREGWLGAVPTDDLTDDRFEQFVSPMFGLRALAVTLHTYQSRDGCRTPGQIARRFAPYPENNAALYAAKLAVGLGVTPDHPVDLRDAGLMERAVIAIVRHENGCQPYDAELIETAIRSAIPGVPG